MAPLTFAHRGGTDGGFPENSLAAFADARDRGCELETDLRLSAGGHVVLIHDALGHRGGWPACPAGMPVRWLRRLDVPTLDDLYRELGGDFELSADVKVRKAAGPAIAIARAAGAVGRLWLVSDNRPFLAALRREHPDVRLIHEARPADLRAEGVSAEQHLARLAADGIDAANTTARGWTSSAVEAAHRLGVAAFGSLLQEPGDMAFAVGIGLDGFYSDHLEAMRAAVQAGSQ